MADIRLQQIAAPNYASSNQLALAANQQLGNAVQGLQDTFNNYRQSVVDKNTSAALQLITGAANPQDLAARQQQVAQMLQQGDIDSRQVNQAAAAMPDTLLGRQTNQLKLAAAQTQVHDAPLQGAYMQAVMSGDQNAAKQILSQFQGDASSALGFAADWQNKQAQLGIQRSELGLRQAQLGATQAAARQRSSQNSALLKQLSGIMGVPAELQDKSTSRDLAAATQQAKDNVNMNTVNNPKLDVAGWATANNDAWFGNDTSNYIYNALKDQAAFKNLNPEQQINVLNGALANENAGGRSGSTSLKAYATDYLTKVTKQLNDGQIGLRQAQDAQDRAAVAAAHRQQLNSMLLPLLLGQQ